MISDLWASSDKSTKTNGRINEPFYVFLKKKDFTVKSVDSLARLALTETANVTRWMDSARVSRATWEFAVKSLAPKVLLYSLSLSIDPGSFPLAAPPRLVLVLPQVYIQFPPSIFFFYLGTFGLGCKSKCNRCKNGAECHHITGIIKLPN